MSSPLSVPADLVVRLDADLAASLRARLAATARALTRDRDLADDLVQDTYSAVLARPRLVRRGDELGYLRSALRNRFRDHLRTSARLKHSGDAGLAEVAEVRPTACPVAAVEHRRVLAAVHALPAPYREAVVAVDVVGLSYEQAAGALGVPVGTIMSRLYRGRVRVADR